MNTSELKSRLNKSVEFLKSELSQLRTGRANPSLVEDVKVKAYDTLMSLKELGSVTLSDSQTILVSPWDATLLEPIAKAIRESEHKLNAIVTGNSIRVPVPSLTEERRKELAKLVSQKVEESKQSLRNIRQDFIKEIEQDFTDKKIGEDEKFTQKEELEKIVKDSVSKVEDLGENKKTDLMTV